MTSPLFICIVFISAATATQGPGYIHCRCSPSGTSPITSGAYNLIQESLSQLNKISGEAHPGIVGTDSGVSGASTILKNCTNIYKEAACIDADAALRSTPGHIPICWYDIESGRNIDSIGLLLKNCDGNEFFKALKAKNEGCVAIEHLIGHKLLYSRHLKRLVLCHNGFCATPNHAIVVSGVGYTSMKRECSFSGKWSGECTVDEKLVNNLRLIYHRKIRINDDITVTAFDYRYPKVVVWIVQILQELPIGIAVCVALTSIIGLERVGKIKFY